ncbi:LEAF RUST 10 DISEASE-RESISTANCE LOCUS RECEPTOR-LIKE PROTEIN KINASE-like 1.1 isoform X2 [Tasmannia lanceolata]|uniref:LEAF RUST 10 DISEASE-RESISTANCE LOCUS RECEPTOR-LIKE PROTEIN KINASE-like 1.1 isoform X2 n=1 Tax=Tasmannia lanceolata TaxID=3420 RepID=UPI004062FBEA
MALTIPCIIVFLFLLFHLAHLSAQQVNNNSEKCPQFVCGNLTGIRFPFFNINTSNCGFYGINCEDNIPKIKFEEKTFIVKNISYEEKRVLIQDSELWNLTKSKICDFPTNFSLPEFPRLQIRRSRNLTVYYCKHNQYTVPGNISEEVRNYTDCEGKDLYYTKNNTVTRQNLLPKNCSTVVLPVFQFWKVWKRNDFLSIFAAGFALEWDIDPKCEDCYKRGGNCTVDERTKIFRCQVAVAGQQHKRIIKKIIIGVSIGVGGILLTCILFYFLLSWYRGKRSVPFFSTRLSPITSSKLALDKSGSALPTHVFSYRELKNATNNFHPSKELGDGGFGTVYRGKLRDGRSVAVKRLYENNCKRVEQFMNEVKILSHLRHQNLVSLYGCTSRHSRELLLVYEFIPNGTVADHLDNDCTRFGGLSWPIRLNIAIETADALAYLHAIEPQIIHRDVKTNNILLDQNFRVKVADFGLSRLFPMDVTHVSTAPQGTPGYVDPDYYKCYQLTDKSDVYSFGVVLIELISSKPAVDMARNRSEINLASMAINKIQNHVLNELVDPGLGFESNESVRRVVTSVAELAFRCLQEEKEVRPSMGEVFGMLRKIWSEEYGVEISTDGVIPVDDVDRLTNSSTSFPDSNQIDVSMR